MWRQRVFLPPPPARFPRFPGAEVGGSGVGEGGVTESWEVFEKRTRILPSAGAGEMLFLRLWLFVSFSPREMG